jgi:voltage-gated potassium channel Kch
LGVNLNAINFNLAARLQALALRQLWISDIERHNPRIAFVLRMSCDYGRSFSRFACWALGAIIAFALFFYLTPHTINKSGFLESLYFSFVTFTTLGYGDIYPVSSLGMIAVILEVTLGYLMLGLLVAIFSKRVLGF